MYRPLLLPTYLLLALLLAACAADAPADELDTDAVATAPAYSGNFAALAEELDAGTVSAAEGARRLLAEFPGVSDAATGALNVAVSQQFVRLSEALSARFPSDTAAALPLYKAAEVALALGEPARAAGLYDTIHRQYASFSKAPESLFMLAFTYDENLGDLERARQHYELFLQQYPDHTFADDSQMLIDNLGKSDEEILRGLEGN